jgi:iron complex outermembrane recepter protein
MRIPANLSRLAMSLGSLLCMPLVAYAQSQPPGEGGPEDADGLEEVMVTGSRFTERTSLSSPSPVDIISAETLRRGGSSELTESLAFEVPALNFQSNRPASPQAATRLFNFRGLPGSQVLVLVNGKRWHPATNGSGSPAFDLNSIPPTSIGRVDILRDGASAQYGSDAISGVFNLVLKDDTETELLGTAGQYYAGDGLITEFSFDTGKALKDTGFVHLTAYHRDVDTSNRQGYDNRQYYFARNAAGQPVILRDTSPTDSTPILPPGFTLDPREHSPETERLRRNSQVSGHPKRAELGASVNFARPMSEAAEIYAFGGYTRRDVDVPAILRRPLDDNVVRAIYPDGTNPVMDLRVNDANAVGGVRGTVGGWDWDLSQSWGFNELEKASYDNINPSLGAASPTTFDAGRVEMTQATTNLDFKRGFDIGRQEPLNFAVGSEYVRQTMEVGAGEPAAYASGGALILDGPNAGRPAAVGILSVGFHSDLDVTDQSRDSVAGYIDMEHQLTPKLLLAAAGRFEEHSDFGSTVNGKVAFLFQATDVIGFRASASTGFRAPSLVDSYFSTTAGQTFFLDGTTLGTFFTRRFAVTDPVAVALGAVPLEPEESENLSAGITLQLPRFSLTADVYSINVADAIVTSSQFNDVGTRNFLASIGFSSIRSVNYSTNAIDLRSEGVDVVANYALDFSRSRLTLTTAANFNQISVTRISPTPAALAAISTIPLFNPSRVRGLEESTPQSRLNFAARYELGAFRAHLRTTRYGSVWGYLNDPLPQKQEADWITDLELSYDVNRSLSVALGAWNVFDKYPEPAAPENNPAGWAPYGASGNFQYQTNGGYYFARALYRFGQQ